MEILLPTKYVKKLNAMTLYFNHALENISFGHQKSQSTIVTKQHSVT